MSDIETALRSAGMLLAVNAAELLDLAQRLERQAADVETLLLRAADALPDRSDGDALLWRLRLEEAAAIVRDLRGSVLGGCGLGAELQTDGLATCTRELVAALDLTP